MPGLRGQIPLGLCQLVNLRRLCICRCGLSGSIPAEISQLSCLEELQLFGNNLTGTQGEGEGARAMGLAYMYMSMD